MMPAKMCRNSKRCKYMAKPGAHLLSEHSAIRALMSQKKAKAPRVTVKPAKVSDAGFVTLRIPASALALIEAVKLKTETRSEWIRGAVEERLAKLL